MNLSSNQDVQGVYIYPKCTYGIDKNEQKRVSAVGLEKCIAGRYTEAIIDTIPEITKLFKYQKLGKPAVPSGFTVIRDRSINTIGGNYRIVELSNGTHSTIYYCAVLILGFFAIIILFAFIGAFLEALEKRGNNNYVSQPKRTVHYWETSSAPIWDIGVYFSSNEKNTKKGYDSDKSTGWSWLSDQSTGGGWTSSDKSTGGGWSLSSDKSTGGGWSSSSDKSTGGGWSSSSDKSTGGGWS